MFNNIKDALNWVVTQTKFREKTDLSIMKQALSKLNIDFNDIKKVHIAGTNGKGSTGAFLAQILIDNNLKVGSYTSPYLVNFNERVTINNEQISNFDLLNYINYFYNFNEELYNEKNIRLSFFEILTLLAFKYFKDNNVDVMLIEVGIGGRLDATNVINYDASIITSIGFDHMQQLGNTLESIALEKLGIIKKDSHLITNVNDTLIDLFINYTNKVGASIKLLNYVDIKPINNESFIYLNEEYKLSLLGDYQRMNALLASETAKYLFNIDSEKIKDSLLKTRWAGRLEAIVNDVYIDGAHNEPAVEALVRNLKVLFKDREITILLSALKGKDITKMLEQFKKVSNKIILTSFDDLRYESLEGYATKDIKYLENGIIQFKNLIKNKKDNEVIIATGSLHFIGYLKQNF